MGPLRTGKIAIHDCTRADVGRFLDMRFQMRMTLEIALVVVVEIAHSCASGKQSSDGIALRVERKIEYRNVSPALGLLPA